MAGYGDLLERFREARGVSQRALAREIGLSHVLVNRSEKSDRPPASPDEIDSVARALGLDDEERDRLLAAAGYWPRALMELGPGDATLRRVAAVLADDRLADEAKARFRRAVDALADLAQSPRGDGT